MGGRGGYGGTVAGVRITTNGATKTYFFRNGKLQNAETLQFIPNSSKSTLDKLISAGGTRLSKRQVSDIVKKRADDRAKTPDYELGNPFRERGKGKSIYRPRRRK